jgi:putative endonuclease
MAEHNELGKQGEELAVAYLREKGYTILDTNFRAGRNEIDIVAREGDMLVIVEVKSRRSNYFAEPEYSVTKDKQKALIRAANSYIYRKNIDLETRFDIMAIILKDEEVHINHLKDAFYPTLR